MTLEELKVEMRLTFSDLRIESLTQRKLDEEDRDWQKYRELRIKYNKLRDEYYARGGEDT